MAKRPDMQVVGAKIAHLRREKRVPHSRIRRGALAFDLNEKMLYHEEKPVRMTRSVSPMPRHKRPPMPMALLMMPMEGVPASVTPRCRG